MAILLMNKPAFDDAKDENRHAKGQRHPEDDMDPPGRVEIEFDEQGATDHNDPNEEHCERSGAIALIERRIVKPAGLATRSKLQYPLK